MIVEMTGCTCSHNPAAPDKTEPLKQGPPRVDDVERYWGDLSGAPPALSPRCLWWLGRIRAGWRPSRRIAAEGYYSSAKYYGVYIWEYLNGIAPILATLRAREGR